MVRFQITGLDDIQKRFGEAASKAESVIGASMNQWAADTIQSARQKHRFTTRTSDLEKSTQFKSTTQTGKLQVWLWLNPAVARYGKFIHDGFKSWSPDRFLDESIERNIKKLPILIEQQLKRLLSK